jgi:transcriptional regulator of arginine metabolism
MERRRQTEARFPRTLPNGRTTLARRTAINRLIRERAIESQHHLGRLLAEEGFGVTQATLSRDLAQLRARRVSRPQGGSVYELEGAPAPAELEQLREMRQMVLSTQENGRLVVLMTQPGAASSVARAIDLARLPECLGTIAGDDTIFAAPRRGSSAQRLARSLRSLFGHNAISEAKS